MSRSFPRRLAGVLLATGLAGVALVPTALGKEGMEAWLATPIPADAQPGDEVTLFITVNRITEAGSSPLRGSEVFFRLYGPSGAMTEANGTELRTAGTYEIRIAVPQGGAASAEFGVRGSRVDPNGAAVASDVVWPYGGVLVAAKVPPPVDNAPARALDLDPARTTATTTATASTNASGPALDLRPAATGIAGLVALVVLSFMARRRLRHTTA